MYKIKTRNWHAGRIGYYALKHWACDSSTNSRDIKCVIETSSAFRAWLLWALWMLLRRLTGGWTYIVRPGHCLGSGYKSIY